MSDFDKAYQYGLEGGNAVDVPVHLLPMFLDGQTAARGAAPMARIAPFAPLATASFAAPPTSAPAGSGGDPASDGIWSYVGLGIPVWVVGKAAYDFVATEPSRATAAILFIVVWLLCIAFIWNRTARAFGPYLLVGACMLHWAAVVGDAFGGRVPADLGEMLLAMSHDKSDWLGFMGLSGGGVLVYLFIRTLYCWCSLAVDRIRKRGVGSR